MVSAMNHHSTFQQLQESASWPVSRVLFASFEPHAVTIHLERLLPNAVVQPTRAAGPEKPGLAEAKPRCPYSVLLPVGFTMPPLLPVARCALTAPFHPYRTRSGGSFSVALSLGSPPPEVIRHRFSVEPGLSSTAPFRALRQRSPGQLADGG
jgi:hypothetical protein